MSTIDVRLFWYAFLLYLVSFLGFTLHAATRGRRVGVAASVLLIAGFVLHTVGILARWRISGHAPMSNMFEYASLLAWMAVLSYIVLEAQYGRRIVGLFVTPVVVALMTCASLLPKDVTQQLVPALQSYWLAIHVTLAALGEGAFAVAFAVSLMYLVQDARERRATAQLAARKLLPPKGAQRDAVRPAERRLSAAPRAGGATVALLEPRTEDMLDEIATFGMSPAVAEKTARMPSLRALDEINYRAIAIGYPLFTIGGLFAGAIWAYNAWGTFWSWDPKEVGAFIIWLFFTAYLHARLQRAWAGRRMAWLSIAGFLMVILSFLGNLWLGGNHAYK
jgi:cytochrome c-type biogenesis protein CcsB